MKRELTLRDIDEAFPKDIPKIICTSPRLLRQFEMILTIPIIEFPTPESLWSFRLRRFKSWIKQLPMKIRWRVFPYHIIHDDDHEEMLDNY